MHKLWLTSQNHLLLTDSAIHPQKDALNSPCLNLDVIFDSHSIDYVNFTLVNIKIDCKLPTKTCQNVALNENGAFFKQPTFHLKVNIYIFLFINLVIRVD